MKTIEEKAILICDGAMGIHIPHLVTKMLLENDKWFSSDGYRMNSDIKYDWSDVPKESVETLLNTPRYTNMGYYEESYWESWEDVLNNLKIEIDGETYHMIQNQDVWLIPDECMDELEEWII
jgi:hypothetical protein